MSASRVKPVNGNEYATPDWLFQALNKEFNFTVDLACTEENKKCQHGLTFPQYNSLEMDWHKLSDGWMFLNPPYTPLKPWVLKAQKEYLLGAKIVMLIPAYVSMRYFQQQLPSEIRFILGRIAFMWEGQEMKGSTTDSMIAIYGPPVMPKISYIERDSLRLVTSGEEN